ncbi:MAG: imidazoleglycerol-phosphate dehydratase HisB [Fimbriimonadaceae bacterium]|jgi:imidazoleglycerol-phosphate dehydratase|nr:imidazoleglycerol-phosphate dehydratase HisB [Fimbriimonadaceae bacterium]
MSKGAPGVRYAEFDRETRETKVHCVLDLDGGNRADVSTGLDFFDHMLHQLAFHGMVDLGIEAEGDLMVDDHHTMEDVGIALGHCIRKALVDSGAIARFASNHTSMDDSLVLVAIDLSGRPYLGWDVPFARESIGGMATENVREFFHALAIHGALNLHVQKVSGFNDHHLCEAIFKGVGIALHHATRKVDRKGVSSTKGQL